MIAATPEAAGIMEVVIMKLISPIVMIALLAMIAACGDKKDSEG